MMTQDTTAYAADNASGPANGVPQVSILIPAYNESERLTTTIEAYYPVFVRAFGETFELLIVVNGSTDNTYQLARDLAASRPQIVVHETLDRIGKGGAVLWGFALSRGDTVAFVDADGSTTPQSVVRLVRTVQNGADAALGSRWLPDSVVPVKQPLKRRILSRIFNLLVRGMFPLPYRDTQCGAKAFRGACLREIDTFIERRGWAFDVELLLRLKQRHPDSKIEEVPIEWRDSSDSRLRAGADGPSMLLDLLRLRCSSPVPPAGAMVTSREEDIGHGSQDR